jgi:hypothetical protein
VVEVVQECADQRCVQVGEVQPGRLFPGVLAREGDQQLQAVANLENSGRAGGGTLWLRINDDDNGLQDNDGHLTVDITTYDRTRRTQWNTVSKRWEYSDDHSPVR